MNNGGLFVLMFHLIVILLWVILLIYHYLGDWIYAKKKSKRDDTESEDT